ncbi:MFS transporter [Kitasatospora sp. NPDC090091]|uniref:MFS transporter n=1 Tax=Kitasatospora sp. NPDC090091 TaxID=3364081 RepID=UPI003811FBA6
MLSSYRQIFAAPGSLAFSSAGFIARLPISMTGIGIVTMLSEQRGSFGVAGAVSATLAIAAGVLGPAVSWLIDRHGQRRVARPAAALTVVAAIGLLLCAHFEAPAWTLFLFAVGMGVMPSAGAMVRARWAHLYRDEPAKLHTAYSLEAVVDEFCFMVGPIVAVSLATNAFPESGVLAAVVAFTVGIALFTAQRRTEPPVHPASAHTSSSAIRNGGLVVLVLTFIATGAIFGSVEIVTVAFAKAQGHEGLAGTVLAVWALGSGLAGMVYGTLKPKGSLANRFFAGVLMMALSMIPVLLVASTVQGMTGLLAVGAALLIAGVAISPTLISAMALVERLVPASQLTEGMAWTTTGLAIGVAFGSAAGGWVVDAAGAAGGYWVPLVAGAFGVLVALAGLRRLQSGIAAPGAPEPAGQTVDLER